MVIKISDIKINKIKPVATDLFLKFECRGVNAELYDFFKDRLGTYRLYIDKEYSLESETQHDEYSKILLIAITIIIPDSIMPKDLEKGSEIIIEQIKLFRNFYEAQNEIYNRSNYQTIQSLCK